MSLICRRRQEVRSRLTGKSKYANFEHLKPFGCVAVDTPQVGMQGPDCRGFFSQADGFVVAASLTGSDGVVQQYVGLGREIADPLFHGGVRWFKILQSSNVVTGTAKITGLSGLADQLVNNLAHRFLQLGEVGRESVQLFKERQCRFQVAFL